MRKRYQRYSAIDDDMLRAGWAMGDTVERIANMLGMPPGSVSYRAGVLGLPARKPGPKESVEWCRVCRERHATEPATMKHMIDGEEVDQPYPLCKTCETELMNARV